MDLATLAISHHVLSLGCVRETARVLGRPVSTVSAAFSRLQSHIARPLIAKSGSRLMPTLEGRRLSRELDRIFQLIVEIAATGDTHQDLPASQRAASLTISLGALFRFVTVVQSGSIRSAAQRIGIGQPQLTRQIRSLETAIGADLLTRVASGAVPTEAGRSLFDLSQDLEKSWSRILDQVGERYRRASRTIRLASVPPLGHESHTAKILALLAARWPHRLPRDPLFIASGNAEDLLSGLSTRQFDLVLIDTIELPGEVEHLAISRSRLTLVARTDVYDAHGGDLHDLVSRNPIALTSLKSGLRQKFIALAEDILTPEERRPLSYVEVDSIPVIANLVLEHGHVALLPQWALRGLEARTRSIVLPDKFGVQLTLVWSPGRGREIIPVIRDILASGGLLQA